MSIAVIINPIAGGRAGAVAGRVELARRVAADCGEAADVSVTEQPGHARALAKAARENGARLIVAWGGDGTVNEVASEIVFSQVPIAIVQSGSGNGLARELGIAVDPKRALAAAMRARPRTIDVGEIDGRLFVNIAGLGLDAYIASQFNASGGSRRGLAGYVGCTARALLQYVPHRYEITTAGVRVATRALLVTLANSAQFGNGVRIAPAARVDDGALDLVVVEESSRLASICRLPRLLTGSVDRVPTWSSRPVEEVTIESDRPMMFHVDGEPVQGGTRLHARVRPGALKICVRED
jgi:diacylglycerol kinase (ATP)